MNQGLLVMFCDQSLSAFASEYKNKHISLRLFAVDLFQFSTPEFNGNRKITSGSPVTFITKLMWTIIFESSARAMGHLSLRLRKSRIHNVVRHVTVQRKSTLSMVEITVAVFLEFAWSSL
jgi:hypothetical protein